MTGKTLISETQHAIAIAQGLDLAGDTVVVTFNSFGFTRNALRFWMDDFLRKQSLPAIGIVTPVPNWYPREAMDIVIAAVRREVGGRRVVTFGNGHGGYGALKFSARLRASVALAISPQWSINPADVRLFDPGFAKYFSDILSNGARIQQEDLCPRAFVIFDNFRRPSAAHAAKLGELRGVQTIRAPFFMHGGGPLPSEGQTVATLLGLCARNPAPAALALRAMLRRDRESSTSYLQGLLRHLIVRSARPTNRSTLFASAVLGKCYDGANSFYSSLLNHVKGDTATALSEFRTAMGLLAPRDLVPLWQIASKIAFADAELSLAKEICARLPHRTSTSLSAVNSLIQSGELEFAYKELRRLAKNRDAGEFVERFVEYSVDIQKPDILEEFLAGTLPASVQITALLGMVKGYQAAGDRKSAFEKLMQVAELCADSTENLHKVSDLFIELGEFSSALDVLKKLLHGNPENYLLALRIVDVKIRAVLTKDRKRIPLELKKISVELGKIMKTPQLPPEAWERAWHLYEDLGELKEARRAIAKALDTPKPSFQMQQRFVVLLAGTRRKRAARRQLQEMCSQSSQDPRHLRILSGLALWLRDRRLARKLAEAQFSLEPEKAESSLFLAKQLCSLGDRNRAKELLAALYEKGLRAEVISNPQWVRLAVGLFEAGDVELAGKAVADAAARNPDSPDVRKLTETITFTQRLGQPSPRPKQDTPAGVQTSFLARIRDIFTRRPES